MDALGKLSEKAGGLTEGAYKVILLAFLDVFLWLG